MHFMLTHMSMFVIGNYINRNADIHQGVESLK